MMLLSLSFKSPPPRIDCLCAYLAQSVSTERGVKSLDLPPVQLFAHLRRVLGSGAPITTA
jgi:hypothetical protein